MPSDHVTPPERYSFGDTALAEERLSLVARVFEAPSRDWLMRTCPQTAELAYDLGCGPGASTALVAEVTGAGLVVGLDSSEAFIESAARGQSDRIRFVRWNVERLPFPDGPADLIYARLLVAHLPHPAEVIRRWGSQLRPTGVLVLDELEQIETTNSTFATYLELSHARVASMGAEMFAGPLLRQVGDIPELGLTDSRIPEYPVDSAAAASMFTMNLDVWGTDAVSDQLTDEATVERLVTELARIRNSDATGEIVWHLHQSAYSPR
jgi:trans-aconitate 2-methyltransferase